MFTFYCSLTRKIRKWYDEYNYEIVVHKDYISDELNKVFESEEAIPLKPWDPMGALAK